MKSYEIIELALELHKQRGGARVPGKIAEMFYQSLVKKWLSRSDPYRRQIEGTVPASMMVPVPGYRSMVTVTIEGDTPIGSLSVTTHAQDNPSNFQGYVVKSSQLYFEEVDEGTAYRIVYQSDHPGVDMEAEPDCPDHLHENLALELSYKFKSFGPVPMTAERVLERRDNKREFQNDLGGRSTQRDRPLQPDPMFAPRS